MEDLDRAWSAQLAEDARLARLSKPPVSTWKPKPKPTPSRLARLTSRITPWGLVVTTFWLFGLAIASKLVPWALHVTGIWP